MQNDQQVVFLPVLKKEQGCTCIYTNMGGKLVAEKSTKPSHHGAVSLIKHLYNTTVAQ